MSGRRRLRTRRDARRANITPGNPAPVLAGLGPAIHAFTGRVRALHALDHPELDRSTLPAF